jgi:hypothetical protein
VAGACAVAGALAVAVPAAADPTAPGTGGAHVATGRIAAVEWCGHGVVGDVDTDRAGHADTATWGDDHQGVGGAEHFTAPPAAADAAAERSDTALRSTAAVSGLRFDPSCAPVAEPGGTVADAFGADDLVTLDAAASTAEWTAGSGAEAEITVEGLRVLGQDADLADGSYEATFSRPLDNGGTAVLEVSVEQHAAALTEGAAHATTATAGLALRFEAAEVDAQGRRTGTTEYRLDLASAGVHSSGPAASPGTTLTPDADRSEPAEPSPSDAAPSPSSPPATPDPAPSPSPSAAGTPTEGTWTPGTAPPRPDGSLPVAGSALFGLVGAGLAAVGGGAAAIYLGRSRKSGFDGDDVGPPQRR